MPQLDLLKFRNSYRYESLNPGYRGRRHVLTLGHLVSVGEAKRCGSEGSVSSASVTSFEPCALYGEIDRRDLGVRPLAGRHGRDAHATLARRGGWHGRLARGFERPLKT